MQRRVDAPVALTSVCALWGPKGELLDTATYASHDWAIRNILRIHVPQRFPLGTRSEAFRECRCRRADELKIEQHCHCGEWKDAQQPATMIAPTTFQFFATGQLGACLRLLRSEDSSVGLGNVGCI